MDAVGPHVHVVAVARSRSAKARCSACHWAVSRVITDADSPAADPKNSPNAGAKSPRSCRAGTSAATPRPPSGLFRHHGVQDRAAEPAPLARRSIDPPVVHPRRRHLDRPRRRRDRARLGVAVADHQPVAALVDARRPAPRCRRRPRPRGPRPASAGRPPARSRRAPHASPPRPSSSVTTLNIGVPSSPACQRRPSSFWFNEEGTPRPRTNGRSTEFRSYLMPLRSRRSPRRWSDGG